MELTFAIALVIGLTQIIKKTKLIADRYLPVIVLLVAIGVATMVSQTFSLDVVVSGIVVGLSSMGMWSGTKTTIQK